MDIHQTEKFIRKVLGYDLKSFVDKEQNVWFLGKDILKILTCINFNQGKLKVFDPRVRQIVLIDGKKYYKHQVFGTYAVSKKGVVVNVKTCKKKKISTNNCGYSFFSVYHSGLSKPKIYYLHRFVYEVFCGPIPKCFEIHHKNAIKTDNRLKNLELVTHKENISKIYNYNN